ncbi:bifunctional nicotinamidase/pyrazinamidase [Dyella subtropica]|uniref:bifunctional nicotinamidase/pyrazinamidase n=1 Tax=Dyella subtropica TaxID=2992127 RepID=UPI002254C540|nr:bifunctional nicotinamidase/pyrazinamidase [Dyella subtropica]
MRHPISERAALILVDVQPDFMPGGSLACHEGDAIVPGIRHLLEKRVFRYVVATQDWHPQGHVSFASSHAGRKPFDRIPLYGHAQTLWPDHCVQGTPGAALHPAINHSLVDKIVRKGSDPKVDSYSGFRENYGPHGTRGPTDLAEWLRSHGVDELYICGLARDVCVLWTAQDAVGLGFKTHVLWDLTRPVTPDTDIATRARLDQLEVDVLEAIATPA